MNDPLQTTLIDAVDFLNREDIAYALIGGMAASLRGQPRTTADVDLVVAADARRALDLLGRLDQSAFRPLFDNVAEVVERSYILPLRHRTTGIKVDMALGLSGFEQSLIDRAERVDIAGSKISVVTAEDLLILKVLAGRPQDEQDAHGIAAAQSQRIDWDYCLSVAQELGDALGQDMASAMRRLRDEKTQ